MNFETASDSIEPAETSGRGGFEHFAAARNHGPQGGHPPRDRRAGNVEMARERLQRAARRQPMAVLGVLEYWMTR